MRLDNKVLFGESTSPFVKSLILKRRAGIPLTEQEQHRFEFEVNKLHESVVSMVEIPRNSDKFSPTQGLKKTFGGNKSIEDMDDEDEIDLDEILREMGYYDEEPKEEIDVEDFDEDELKEYIRKQIRESFHKEMETLDYEKGPVGEVPDLEEIIMELEHMEDGDEELDEGLTYDVQYASYNGGRKKYHNIRRTFNNDNHFSNWYKWMSKQGLKIIGVHPIE